MQSVIAIQGVQIRQHRHRDRGPVQGTDDAGLSLFIVPNYGITNGPLKDKAFRILVGLLIILPVRAVRRHLAPNDDGIGGRGQLRPLGVQGDVVRQLEIVMLLDISGVPGSADGRDANH